MILTCGVIYNQLKKSFSFSVYAFFISALCNVSVGYAQSPEYKTDSIIQILAQTNSQKEKLDLFFRIGESLWFNRHIPEAITYLEKTIASGEEQKDYRYNCNALLLLGHARMRMKQYAAALAALKTSAECSQKNNQPEHIPKVYQAYATLYNLLGDNAKAIDYALKAADGYEASTIPNINEQSVFAWLDAGRIFEQQNQPDKAAEYYNRSLQKAMSTGKPWLKKAPMLGVANILVMQGKLPEARRMYQDVIDADRKEGGTEPTMDGLNGLGNIAVKEKDYPAAVSFYKAALDTSVNRNFIIAADGFAAKTGYAHFLNGQYDSASRYLMLALRAARESGDLKVLQEVYTRLAEMEIKKGNYGQAVDYQEQIRTISDSLYNMNRVRVINNIEILYQTEKKEKSILALQAVNAQKEVAIVKRNRILLTGSIAMTALVLLLSLYLRNAKHRRRLAENEKKIQAQQIDFLKEQQQVVSLQSMVNGQETERTRIAKDLHDGLGGLFSTVKMYFSTLQHEQEGLKANALFSKSYELIDTASEEVRRIAHNMMPEVLMKLGLVHALQDMCHNISAGKLLLVKFQSYGMEKRMNASTEIMLYRIVQELLNNIIKHAHASEAIVQFNREGTSLHVTVEDNGRGFNLQEAVDKKHAGLEAIKSRVNYLNGNISIDSQKQVGTTVTMEFLINTDV